MQKSDGTEFSDMMDVLSSVFGEECKLEKKRGYWKALSDLSLEQISEAVDSLQRESKFMPRPAHIREAAGIMPSAEVTKTEAAERWALACRVMSDNGTYCEPSEYLDELSVRVIRSIGGWSSLCQCQESDLKWRRKEFLERYTELSKATVDESKMLPAPKQEELKVETTWASEITDEEREENQAQLRGIIGDIKKKMSPGHSE